MVLEMPPYIDVQPLLTLADQIEAAAKDLRAALQDIDRQCGMFVLPDSDYPGMSDTHPGTSDDLMPTAP